MVSLIRFSVVFFYIIFTKEEKRTNRTMQYIIKENVEMNVLCMYYI